jgi:hypothetical protein
MVGETESPGPAVVALAGRRIDAPGSSAPRFPLENVPLVRQRLADAFVAERAVALVCSAACGADLLALEMAERLGLRRRIVLPFRPQRFRETSVVDRPGDWGPVFDRLIAYAMTAGDLIVRTDDVGNDDAAYAAANVAIIQDAQELARASEGVLYRLLAMLVWEGSARAGTDSTEGFESLALEAGFTERYVLTR